jgi:nucleotide-binding universal stress UspA family protein
MSPTEKQSRASHLSAAASTQLHTLLVPIDLTPGADRVVGRVALLRLADDARITLLHVVPGGLLTGEEGKAVRDANKALAGEVRQLRKQVHKNVRVEAMVKVGSPAKEIATCATSLKAELIVMGRCGGRVLRDAFLGSTAERVIRQAQIPVLVVRLAPRELYSRPALALDLDPVAHDVVRLMLRVLPLPPPRVEVVHAFDIPYRGLIYPSLPADDVEERKGELRANALHQLTQLLAAGLAKAHVRPENAPIWKTHVHLGSPRLIVEKAMKKFDTDLLVLGTHGYSGTAYVLLGTVAGDLLRAAKCDVLVVPPTPSSK